MEMKEITVDGVVYVQKEPTKPKHGWVVGHEYGWGRTDERRKCLEITEDGRAFLSPYPNDGYHIPYTWGNSWVDLTLQEEHAKDALIEQIGKALEDTLKALNSFCDKYACKECRPFLEVKSQNPECPYADINVEARKALAAYKEAQNG